MENLHRQSHEEKHVRMYQKSRHSGATNISTTDTVIFWTDGAF